jgi:hypothetical protein
VIVFRAADTKSCVFMNESRGGLASGANDLVTSTGGLTHSEVMLEESRVPRCFETWSVFWIKEGACISLYAVDASRPA